MCSTGRSGKDHPRGIFVSCVLIACFLLGSDNESDEEGLGRKALTAQVTRAGRSCPSFHSLFSGGVILALPLPLPPGHTPRGHRLGHPRQDLAYRVVLQLPELCLGTSPWVLPSQRCCCCSAPAGGSSEHLAALGLLEALVLRQEARW